MVILSVDLGKTRTGLAVSDKSETFSFPREVIKEYSRERLYEKIAEVAKKEKAEMIVLGLPKNMDGSQGFKAEESHNAKEALQALTGLPIELYDERCTTVIAQKSLWENGINTKKGRKIVDTVAATVILEDFLNYRKNKASKP